MTAPNTSLTTRVTDTFTAPRWVHYLVKVATGAIALAAYLLAFAVLLEYSILASRLVITAALCSWSLFMVGRVKYFLDHRNDFSMTHPTTGPDGVFDRERGLVKPDLWCDMALHCIPIAAALWLAGLGLAAFVVALVCLVAFRFSYPWASP